MKPIRQLLRQPWKLLSGVLLMALAVAVLVLCLGQSLAAGETMKDLDYNFTTLALATDNYNLEFKDDSFFILRHMNEEVDAWLQQVIAEHPELVEGYSQTGLASAWIPQLKADHYATYVKKLEELGQEDPVSKNKYHYISVQDGAMLVVTLEEIGEPIVERDVLLTLKDQGTGGYSATDLVTVTLQARIDRVLCLAEEQTNPVGWPIELTLKLGSREELEHLELEVGGQYIVNGIDYYDCSQLIGQYIEEQTRLRNLTIGEYDESKLYFLTEEDAKVWLTHNKIVPVAIYGDKNVIKDGIPRIVSPLTGNLVVDNNKVFIFDAGETKRHYEALQKYKTAQMTLSDPASLPWYSQEDGSLLENRVIEVNGQTQTITWAQYAETYGMPTIEKLTGSVEDFLAANPRWSQWLEYQQINTHAFPVFAVDKLDYIADFNRGQAHITLGRDFSRKEVDSGAKVCIISETLAQLNGLRVGDTITPQFYDYDQNVSYQFLPGENERYLAHAMANPAYFHSGSSFVGEAEEYTIVGIYRQNSIWEEYDDNNYAFSPNTIFVPKASVTAPLYYSDLGVFNVLVLKNGKSQAFDNILLDKEFETYKAPTGGDDAMFVYTDQGYMLVSASLMNYVDLARQVLAVGLVVYGIILGLFLLLYPLRQGKTLRTMANFGAPRKDKLAYVVVSSLGILLPGTVLGAALGVTLWGVVVGRLLSISSALFSLTLDFGTLALISLAQLVLAIVLVTLLAIPMTRQKNLMKR